jgi:putative ABC transport system permease protein
MVLLCGAGLLIRTMWKLNAVQPGFDPEGVLVAEIGLPNTKYPTQTSQAVFSEELLERMKTLPEVVSVGATTNLPMSGTNMMFMASVEGGTTKPAPAGFRSVAGDYFQTMRVPLLKGRLFDERDTGSSTHVAVVNETMARQIAPGGEAIGKRIKHGFKQATAEVVGVVGDVKYEGLDSKNKPEMYVPFAQRAWPFLRLVVRAKTEPARLAAAVRSQVQAIDKDQPVDKMRTMRAILNTSTAPRRFYAQLLGAFAALAFMLAALGIYGVVSYSVTRRTREIGIRMAVGAKQRDVLRMVLAEGLAMSFIGGLLGLAGAFAATRMLRNLLFEVSATDPGTFVTLLFLLAGVALLASYIPARRATKVDPLTALRYE